MNESFLTPNTSEIISPKDTGILNASNVTNIDAPSIALELHQMILNDTMVNLSNIDRIDTYTQPFQTAHSNLLLVTDTNSPRLVEEDPVWNMTAIAEASQQAIGPSSCLEPYYWICLDEEIYNGFVHTGNLCGNVACAPLIPEIKSNASNWRINGSRISYCLSQQPEQHCKLQYNVGFAIIVIAFNAVKTAIMIYTAFGVSETPLLTVGDAIASFMRREDTWTRRKCLLSRLDIDKFEKGPHLYRVNVESCQSRPSSFLSDARTVVQRCKLWSMVLLELLVSLNDMSSFLVLICT